MPVALMQWMAGVSAIGTGAFGIVDTLKGTPLGVLGSTHVVDAMGAPGRAAFKALYGDDYEAVIKQAYRGDPKKLGELLKRALRLAIVDPVIATSITALLGQTAAEPDLGVAAAQLDAQTNGTATLTPADVTRYTARIASYTTVVDARVDAAIAASASQYEAGLKLAAMVVSVALSIALWFATRAAGASWDAVHVAPGEHSIWEALLLGFLAVPVAPAAKDATNLLQAVSDILSRRVKPAS